MGIPALFEARGGIRIGAELLSITGQPGLGDAYSDAAIKGALCLDETNGHMYQKTVAGSGADKWVRIQNQDDVNAAIMGQSWRPPVKAMDDTSHADLTAAETAMNTGSVDAVSVVENDRVLFTNITGANQNVFVVTGTPGASATLVEDTNDASKGDALYVQEGTHAGAEMGYNGTVWVQQGKASVTEIGHIQSFIGKSANGSETPDYASNHVVTDTETLEKAIGDLDAEVGAAVATPQSRTIGAISDQAINLNVEALDDALGADVTSTNQAAAGNSVNDNITALDTAIGDDVTGAKSRTAGAVSAQNVNANIEALDTAIGADVTSTRHVVSSNDLNGNISILDRVLGDAKTESKSDAVSTTTTLDTVLVDEILVAEWTVHARSAVTASNIWTGKILAIHDGTSGLDATAVDYNTFAILKTGSAIPALNFECDLSGVGAAQVMRLRASSGEAVHIRWTRSVMNEQ